MEYPQVFETADTVYEDSREGRGAAIADALMGWGLCMSGTITLPPKFGQGMVLIGKVVGEAPTPDNVDRLYGEWMAGGKSL